MIDSNILETQGDARPKQPVSLCDGNSGASLDLRCLDFGHGAGRNGATVAQEVIPLIVAIVYPGVSGTVLWTAPDFPPERDVLPVPK